MVDFAYYCDDFGGAEFESEQEFRRFADRASRFVRYVMCTEQDFDDDDVKSCICALAEEYAGRADGVVREKIDDFETEYSADDSALMHTVRLYLPPILLYRGI